MATEAISACSRCLLGWPLNWAKKELNYVFNFKSFVDTLNKENGKLGPLLTDLNGLVSDAIDGEEAIILETAKKLLGDMDEKHKVATELVDGNSIPNTCCWGFCGDCNCKHRRDVAKKADRLAKEIVELINSGDKYITQLSKPARSLSDGKQQNEKLNRRKPNVAISSPNVQSKSQPLPATEPNIIVSPNGGPKKTIILDVNHLHFEHGENAEKWRLIQDSSPNSMELIIVHYMHIEGTVTMTLLSPTTNYGAYFVYKLGPNPRGFKSIKVDLIVGSTCRQRCLDLSAATSFLKQGSIEESELPNKREDGWMEIEMGVFFAEESHGHGMKLVVNHLDTNQGKSGLLVRGIEIRPLETT